MSARRHWWQRPETGRAFSALVVLALVIAGATGIAGIRTVNRITESAEFCDSCHEMNWQKDTLSASAHKDLECVNCHAGPGFIGWLGHAASGLRSFAGHVLGKPVEATGEVRDTWCLQCHDDLEHRLVEGPSSRVAHGAFLRSGRRCVFCHRELVHGPPGERNLATGDRAPAPTGDVAAGAPVPTDETASDAVPSSECTQCHQQRQCDSCHRSPMPHPNDWLTTHGTADTQACSQCHEPRECSDCHGTTIPHPPNWSTAHATASGNGSTCTKCHDRRTCEQCHDRHRLHGKGVS